MPLLVSGFAESHKPIIRDEKSSNLGGTLVDPDYRPGPAFIDLDLDLDPRRRLYVVSGSGYEIRSGMH